MTLTSAPVEAESSVTELPEGFVTQMWVPSEVTASGPSEPVVRAADDLDQGPGRGRELRDRVATVATQMWVPSDVTASGPSNP